MSTRALIGRMPPVAVENFVFKKMNGSDRQQIRDDEIDDDTSPSEGEAKKGHMELCIEALRASAEAAEDIVRYYDIMDDIGDPVQKDDPYLAHLISEKSVNYERSEYHRSEVETLQRIMDTGYMEDVFCLLDSDFEDDAEWDAYLSAALDARINFREYRELDKRARSLSKEISEVSLKLASLVRGIRDTGSFLPDVLMPPRINDGPIDTSSLSPEVSRMKLRRWALYHFYGNGKNSKNPEFNLFSLLIDLSKAMDVFEPDFMDSAVHFGMSTRQNSKKTAYIRAFAAHLQNNEIKTTAKIKKSMAFMANVVLNDPNMSITEDDVRKALSDRNPVEPASLRESTKRSRPRKTRNRNGS
jgi:hypothetical protein